MVFKPDKEAFHDFLHNFIWDHRDIMLASPASLYRNKRPIFERWLKLFKEWCKLGMLRILGCWVECP